MILFAPFLEIEHLLELFALFSFLHSSFDVTEEVIIFVIFIQLNLKRAIEQVIFSARLGNSGAPLQVTVLVNFVRLCIVYDAFPKRHNGLPIEGFIAISVVAECTKRMNKNVQGAQPAGCRHWALDRLS